MLVSTHHILSRSLGVGPTLMTPLSQQSGWCGGESMGSRWDHSGQSPRPSPGRWTFQQQLGWLDLDLEVPMSHYGHIGSLLTPEGMTFPTVTSPPASVHQTLLGLDPPTSPPPFPTMLLITHSTPDTPATGHSWDIPNTCPPQGLCTSC